MQLEWSGRGKATGVDGLRKPNHREKRDENDAPTKLTFAISISFQFVALSAVDRLSMVQKANTERRLIVRTPDNHGIIFAAKLPTRRPDFYVKEFRVI